MTTIKPRDSLLEQFVKTLKTNNIHSTKDQIKKPRDSILEQFIKTAHMNNIRPTKDQIKNDIKDIEESFDKIHSILQRVD